MAWRSGGPGELTTHEMMHELWIWRQIRVLSDRADTIRRRALDDVAAGALPAVIGGLVTAATVPVTGAESPVVAAGDPSSSRIVYSIVVALVVIGVALVALALWVFRQTRVDLELLAPLETMSDRRWRRLDPASQRRMLDEERPQGAEPLHPAVGVPDADEEFAAGGRPVEGFDDLRGEPFDGDTWDEVPATADHDGGTDGRSTGDDEARDGSSEGGVDDDGAADGGADDGGADEASAIDGSSDDGGADDDGATDDDGADAGALDDGREHAGARSGGSDGDGATEDDGSDDGGADDRDTDDRDTDDRGSDDRGSDDGASDDEGAVDHDAADDDGAGDDGAADDGAGDDGAGHDERRDARGADDGGTGNDGTGAADRHADADQLVSNEEGDRSG